MKYIDLFAGCGGLSLGFESVGFESVGFKLGLAIFICRINSLYPCQR
jgi:hypothetical protein